MKKVTVLGSTGSVGASTIDLLKAHGDRYSVHALIANQNIKQLAEDAIALQASCAVTADENLYQPLKELLSGTGIEVMAGEAAILDAASDPVDLCVAAIVGAAGLKPTLKAIEGGADIALANKECLVSSGTLFLEAIKRHKSRLLPVDSEHNAIFQVLEEHNKQNVSRLILTASGGPFRGKTRGDLQEITPDQAVAHPNWSMGAKISVDSASLMNKGLELIEAHYLFGIEEQFIETVVHPQSIIHSMVEYTDGSVLAQLGSPDMRIPIASALAWPERLETNCAKLDFFHLKDLTFEAPDLETFKCLKLARQALQQKSGAMTVLNSANEVAVAAFLAGQIGFLDIADLIEKALSEAHLVEPVEIEDVFALDAQGRDLVRGYLTS